MRKSVDSVMFLLIWIGGAGPLAADCEIGFEGYPDGADVTNQYLSCGVVEHGELSRVFPSAVAILG